MILMAVGASQDWKDEAFGNNFFRGTQHAEQFAHRYFGGVPQLDELYGDTGSIMQHGQLFLSIGFHPSISLRSSHLLT
jgi:hypothetical protein